MTRSRTIIPEADGTVHLGPLVVPVPSSISAEARQYLAFSPWGGGAPPAGPIAMWDIRAQADAMFKMMSDRAALAYPVAIEDTAIAGVRTQIVRPKDKPAAGGGILINLHGGGFVLGGGSLVEAIPIASLTGLPVYAVDYRLAPEHPFPAAVDDAAAVYRALLKDHAPGAIGVYGASAGAMLTGQMTVRLQQAGLPLPACLGMFTGSGDLSQFGDTVNLFTLMGFWGDLLLPLDHEKSEIRAYLAGADPKDPAVSPIHGDLARFPPSLLVSGTRDALLSATSTFHRALRKAGAEADLFVFDAMPHAHWYAFHLPEAKEALDIMARFFLRHLRG
jgi:acetyl esterase/lipase